MELTFTLNKYDALRVIRNGFVHSAAGFRLFFFFFLIANGEIGTGCHKMCDNKFNVIIICLFAMHLGRTVAA